LVAITENARSGMRISEICHSGFEARRVLNTRRCGVAHGRLGGEGIQNSLNLKLNITSRGNGHV